MVAGNFKVCVVGGAGGIGQPLSMLMAMDPNVAELCVYDLTIAMVPAEGVAADLSHLNMKSKVKGYAFDKDDRAIEKAAECLTGCHLVLVPAGVPRKPGQDRKDLLNINAGIAKNIVEACAKYMLEVITRLKNKGRINGRLLQTENGRMVHETKKFRGENKINEGKTEAEALSGLREEVRRPWLHAARNMIETSDVDDCKAAKKDTMLRRT